MDDGRQVTSKAYLVFHPGELKTEYVPITAILDLIIPFNIKFKYLEFSDLWTMSQIFSWRLKCISQGIVPMTSNIKYNILFC